LDSLTLPPCPQTVSVRALVVYKVGEGTESEARVATGRHDGQVCVFGAETGALLQSLQTATADGGHAGEVYSLDTYRTKAGAVRLVGG
jgi:hypothetical protein